MHKFCAVDIFWIITRCQVPSRVWAWFYDSAGNIDFYQVSLSQSESSISHESIILKNISYQAVNEHIAD